jgi:hypothetical protein
MTLFAVNSGKLPIRLAPTPVLPSSQPQIRFWQLHLVAQVLSPLPIASAIRPSNKNVESGISIN